MHFRTPQKNRALGVLRVLKSLKAPPNKAYRLGTPTKKSRNTKLQDHQWCSERATYQAGAMTWPDRHILRACETQTHPQRPPVGRCSHNHHQHWAASYSAGLARGFRGEGA